MFALPPADPRCHDCSYWSYYDEDPNHNGAWIGFCRRHPPPPAEYDDDVVTDSFPLRTHSMGWCGEYCHDYGLPAGETHVSMMLARCKAARLKAEGKAQ